MKKKLLSVDEVINTQRRQISRHPIVHDTGNNSRVIKHIPENPGENLALVDPYDPNLPVIRGNEMRLKSQTTTSVK